MGNCFSRKPIPISKSSVCPSKYSSIRSLFIDSFNDTQQVGSSFCVYDETGELLINLLGGYANHQTGELFDTKTITHYQSTSKMSSNFVIAMLVSQGLIKYDEKICEYWKGFEQEGKENITVEMLMKHEAGLFIIEKGLDEKNIGDNEFVKNFLEKQKTVTKPGEITAYHANTRGLFLNQLVRQVDKKNRTIGEIMREEFNKKLDANFFVGLKGDEFDRLARTYNPVKEMITSFFRILLPENCCCCKQFETYRMVKNLIFHRSSNTSRAFECTGNNGKTKTKADVQIHNREILSVENPSGSSGFGDAISLAKLAAIFAQKGTLNGIEFIKPEVIERALVKGERRIDQVSHVPITFTSGGFGLMGKVSEDCYGWTGVGGSLCFFDTKRKLGFGYVRNGMALDLIDKYALKMMKKVIEIYDKTD